MIRPDVTPDIAPLIRDARLACDIRLGPTQPPAGGGDDAPMRQRQQPAAGDRQGSHHRPRPRHDGRKGMRTDTAHR